MRAHCIVTADAGRNPWLGQAFPFSLLHSTHILCRVTLQLVKQGRIVAGGVPGMYERQRSSGLLWLVLAAALAFPAAALTAFSVARAAAAPVLAAVQLPNVARP